MIKLFWFDQKCYKKIFSMLKEIFHIPLYPKKEYGIQI